MRLLITSCLVSCVLTLCAQKVTTDFRSPAEFLKEAERLKEIDKDSALYYANTGIALSQRIVHQPLLANLMYAKAKIFDQYTLWDSSTIYYKQAIPIFLKDNDLLCAARCFINIGATDYYYGRYDSALVAFSLASHYLENTNDKLLTSKVFNNLGLLNKSMGNYTRAILYFQNVIDILESTPHEYNRANAYFNIGIIYWEQNNQQDALKNYTYCYDIYTRIEAPDEDIANTCNNMGLVYSSLNDTERARQLFDKAIELFANVKDRNGMASAMINKGVLLENAGLYNDAELMLLQAVQIYEQNGYMLGKFVGYSNLSKLYSLLKNKKKAISYAQRALDIEGIDKPIKYTAQCYLLLASTFWELNDNRQSAEYYKKYIAIKDSLFSLEINKQISEMQTRFETEKKEIQINNLHQQVRIQDLELKNKQKQILFIATILGLIFASAVLFIILYIEKRKSYMLLVKQNVKLALSDIEREKVLLSQELEPSNISRYADTGLTQEHKENLLSNLNITLEKEKSFLNEGLTLNDLAKKIGSNRNYLSQIINEHYRTNFNNFVNEFRVKEARKLLLNPCYSSYSIEGIAQTVGFNSKVTFNAAFKKFTGVTPSFFRSNSKDM